MLRQISVRNFALIENAQLEIKNGFTVITGETGSGKSILLGALKLILGERADYSVIRDQEKKTIVEAVFELSEANYSDFFLENDLDFEEDTFIRREINSNGKSRAFINDTPVQLAVLKDLTERLVHIHSQHHTLALKDKNFQRSILDTIAENQKLLLEVKKHYEAIKKRTKEIESLEENRAKIALEHEFNTFQIEELSKLDLTSLNYEAIEKEVERGEQFEEIQEAFKMLSYTINNEMGVADTLQKMTLQVKAKDKKVEELMERIKSTLIELKDIGDVAEDELSEMIYEPEEMHINLSRLDAFNSALRKHNLRTQEELLNLLVDLQQEVGESGDIDESIRLKKAELEEITKKAMTLSATITEKRKKVAEKIERESALLLEQLKLEGASIKFDFKETSLSEFGCDEIVLYFSPNKGMPPQAIEKAASGGELSRLMLVVQFLLSQKQKLPTVIFDEIDTGVSGEVAQKIGEHLKNMGTHTQLMAITHLPQVASKGQHHILVEKYEEGKMTKTSFKNLDSQERIKEIAKLMSGSTINEAALLNAKKLMDE